VQAVSFKPNHQRLLALLLGATIPLLVGLGGVADASSSSAIEGVWSFKGGEVAVQPLAGGTYAGTVVAPTQFAQCSHPIGEQMWTTIAPQADGSYFGLHQWYFEDASCTPNPTLGPTAWRVLATADGSRFLRVCFSSPGSSQPTIAPDGSSAHVTRECVDSALIAPLPPSVAPTSRAGALSFARAVSLPSNRKCTSQRVFQIHLRDPKNDPFKKVVVTLGKHRVTVVRHGRLFASTINLKGLPRGSFTVKIRATTVLGHHLSGSRTYHTCVKRRRKASKPKRLHSKSRAHGS
jgi:hypothetical protein